MTTKNISTTTTDTTTTDTTTTDTTTNDDGVRLASMIVRFYEMKQEFHDAVTEGDSRGALLIRNMSAQLCDEFNELARNIVESSKNGSHVDDAGDETCTNVTIPTMPEAISEIAKKYGVHIKLYHVVDTSFINAEFSFTVDHIDDGSRYTALVRFPEVTVEFSDNIVRDMFHAAFDACAEMTLFDIMQQWLFDDAIEVCETGWRDRCAPESLSLDDARALAKRAVDHFEQFIDELNELAVAPANEPAKVTISRDVLERLNDILAGTVGVHDADVVLDTSDNSVYTRGHISATDYTVYRSDDDKRITNICENDLCFYSAMTTGDCVAFDDADEETRIQIIERTLRHLISKAI